MSNRPGSSRPIGSPRPGSPGPAPGRSGAPAPGESRVQPLDDAGGQDGGDPNKSTQFFAIPKAQLKRRKSGEASQAPAEERGAGGAPQPPGGAQGGGPGLKPPINAPAVLAPVANAQAGAWGQQPAAMTRSTSASPFAKANSAAIYEPPQTRSRSYRVIAIFGLMFLSLFAAAAVAIVAIVIVALNGGIEGTTEAAKKLAGAPTKNTQDEVYEENSWIKQDVTIGGGGGGHKVKSNTEGTTTTPEVPAGPTTAPLTITLNGGSAKYVRISCTDGYVQKIKLSSSNSATAGDVPMGEDCKVSLEGGGDVASYNRAVAGKSYTCDVKPPQLICR